MNDSLNLFADMPSMLSGQDLVSTLSVFPEYSDFIRNENQTVRLMALSDLYRLYIPSQMSIEIYSSMYLALLRSMQKKVTKAAIKQQYQNHKAIQNQAYRGIMGGADSFTIIGDSGIGKTSAISRAVDLITENRVIEMNNPYTKIIPILNVQCPWDSSIKQLLLEVLRKVDETIESSYYQYALKSRALNHIGILVIDEIQNIVNSKNGKRFITMLLQLINNSGISLCLIGVPNCIPFFEQTFQLSRRLVGLKYGTMPFDAYFESFCKVIFGYQYVKEKSQITPAITEFLYEHSAGVVSVVVSLIHDAQEIGILSGKEVLNLDTLNQAYKQRLSLLHGYIQPTISHGGNTSKRKKKSPAASIVNNENVIQDNPLTIKELVAKAKAENLDIVPLLKEHFVVVEVSV